MKIATWNVNSIGVRLPQVLTWLEHSSADVLALQETKCIDSKFPIDALLALGYHAVFAGQPKYNGVAIVSRHPIEPVTSICPWDHEQKRFLSVRIHDLDVINVYVPNGQSLTSEKYTYKLAWLESLQCHLQQVLQSRERMLVVGDFNIAPDDDDVHDVSAWEDSVLVSPAERLAFQSLLDLGLVDLVATHCQRPLYTWWDYRRQSFQRNRGLRIDHMLASPTLARELAQVGVDQEPRSWERPSDHTVVWADWPT